MTTVSGFNHLIQQSGIVREINQSTNTLNPELAHATAEQVSNEQERRKKQESEEENNSDSTGMLLDTIV